MKVKTSSDSRIPFRSVGPLPTIPTYDFVIKPSTTQPCKFWWTDPATGQLPVFAGLPFLSWSGSYAIHGRSTTTARPAALPAPRLRLARLHPHGGGRRARGLRAHQGRRVGAGARAARARARRRTRRLLATGRPEGFHARTSAAV